MREKWALCQGQPALLNRKQWWADDLALLEAAAARLGLEPKGP